MGLVYAQYNAGQKKETQNIQLFICLFGLIIEPNNYFHNFLLLYAILDAIFDAIME